MAKTDSFITKEVLKTVQDIQSHLHDIDIGLDRDRQSNQNLAVEVARLSEESAQNRKAINSLAERMKVKTMEATEPITESVDKLTAQIEKSKTVVIKEETKNWFKRLFRIK